MVWGLLERLELGLLYCVPHVPRTEQTDITQNEDHGTLGGQRPFFGIELGAARHFPTSSATTAAAHGLVHISVQLPRASKSP